jgi:predicted 3-demethylubiquinone-9 3-methyltransferase (glyoxalase superfamily)
LNGGPIFKFTEAVSFVVDCGTQGEIDDEEGWRCVVY